MPRSFPELPMLGNFLALQNTVSPAAQNTSLPAAQITDHAEASSDPVPAYPIRSGYSNLQRFFAFMNCLNCFDYFGEESINNHDFTRQDIAKYKDSVNVWVDSASSPDERTNRSEAAERINSWLQINNRREVLDLSGLNLDQLPPLPSVLTQLDVSDNPLTSLPENLPDTLDSLYAYNSHLTHLPENLPGALRYLDISHTRITEIPESLRQAASRPENPCTVIAQDVSAWLSLIGARNAHGVGRTSPALHEAVQTWYDAPDGNRQAAWEKIHQEAQGAVFTDVPFWALLDSLKGSAEYPAEAGDTVETKEERETTRAAFKKRVTGLLNEIQKNGELRRECFKIAYDAVETCHDNVALGFEQMELEHLKIRAAQGEFAQQELARLGMGTFKLAVLDELAAEKAYKSGNADEAVEVVLAYRTKLAAELDLPTKTKEMLYYETAEITDDDLAVARENVTMATEDTVRIVSFLANWKPWQKDLERRYPEKFDAAAIERGQEALHEKMEALQDTYEKYVKEEGEDSTGALNTREEMNALMKKFDTLEQDLFRDARKQLTKEFMAA